MLVLSPTRELAAQIAENMRGYAKFLNLSVQCVFGGIPVGKQARALVPGCDILVATPGRLLDLIDQRALTLRNVEIFVLDEADQMMDLGFIVPLKRVAAMLPKERQSLFFSATMPKAIADLGKQFIHNPVRVEVTPQATTAERVEQYAVFINQAEKQALLTLSLRKGLAPKEDGNSEIDRALVFTRTKHGADRVVRHLTAAGISAAAIHGNQSQAQRTAALLAFRKGTMPVLVATDIAARGIDVSGVSHVFNFELPNVAEQYVHRIGRTARAGADGVALSFCAPDEKAYLRDIEKLTGVKLASVPLPENFQKEAAGLPAPSRKPAEAEQDARREARDARGRGGARPPRANNNRANGGQSRDGQSRDQYIRNERMADGRRATAPRGPVYNPLGAEDREARQYAPRDDNRDRRDRRDDRSRQPQGERGERAERPVKIHRDAVRPAGNAPRGDGQPKRNGGNRKKSNGGGQRRWG